METEYDKGLLLYIENNGFSNIIKINEQVDDVIEDIEENFVMGFGGIDWGQSEIICSQKLDSNFVKYLEKTKVFLEGIGKSFPNLLDEKVCVIGDNLTNYSYEMAFKDFMHVSEQFLSIPQHTYIWFADSKKCINFSFENEVYFG